MKYVLLFVLFNMSLFCFSQTDLNISATIARETEPFIAINPANPDNLIAAWMSVSYPPGIATKSSFDGGVTWGNVNYLPHFSGNILITSADVSLAFNLSGTAFICYVDYKLSLDSGFVRVAKSVDGGISWSNPVNAANAMAEPDLPIDRPWIVCDQSNSMYGGRIYIVTKSYYAATVSHKIWLSISTDTANTFSPLVRLDDPVAVGSLNNIMGTPAVGADGTFYCAYASWDTTQNPFPRFVCTKSTDGGTTFAQTTITYPVVGSAITDTLYQGSYSMVANPADAGNLIFQAVDARYGDPDILSLFSMDGGNTWSSVPVRVNDDATNNGKGQDMSWGSFSSDGTYAVVWRDRRNGLSNDTSDYEIYTATSTNGGFSFSPNYCLSSIPSPFINLVRGNDFLGVALTTNDVYSVWSDNRNNGMTKEDIYFRKANLDNITSNKSPVYSTDEFAVSLNRSTETVHVFTGKQKIKQIELFNMQGKLVNEYSKNDFSVSGLPNGIYFIRVETNQTAFTRKLFK